MGVMAEISDDDQLLADLADALAGVRPSLDRVAARAKDSFVWRTIDEDLLLAELSFDSSLEEAAQTRAVTDDARVLVFTASPQSVEIELFEDRLVGQFLPPVSGVVRIEDERGQSVESAVDEFGFFVVEPAPSGVVRFHCETGTTRIRSDWVIL